MIEKELAKILEGQDRVDLYKAVIDALSKQLPRPIDRLKSICAGMPVCGNCNGFIQNSDKYCPNCGQKIDWER